MLFDIITETTENFNFYMAWVLTRTNIFRKIFTVDKVVIRKKDVARLLDISGQPLFVNQDGPRSVSGPNRTVLAIVRY